ncbi:MRE11A family protein [Megaselia abdita]
MASESEGIASVSAVGGSEAGDGMTEENVMKIMIATDNHLGYFEKDPVRGNDSFLAFEEILKHAVSNDVDFILLGGDLFHDATPSQNSLKKCMDLLRKYTLGSKTISLEFLSDQTINFVDCFNSSVNYEDPNLNVSIPVFSIHGNHDDPSGYGLLSSLDLLATCGLVNYFGKRTDLTKLDIYPILMRKGVTQLAIYGLSYIHDSRLVRLFMDDKVVMKTPDETTGNWFNLMVLHQNRANRGLKNYLPEDILPPFLDFILWGHEHDCRIEPEQHFKHQFHVCQPGSSTPTSLSEGESIQKHCGILCVYKDKFKLEKIPLKTVRPFVFKSIDLHSYAEDYGFDEGDTENKVMALVREQVEKLISEAEEKVTGHPDQPTLPLIRLRCVYENEEHMFNAIRFGQEFATRVANPSDLIKFKKLVKRVDSKSDIKVDGKAIKDMMANTRTSVEDVVEEYFEKADESDKLKIMSTKVLNEVTNRIVNRNDTTAADSILKWVFFSFFQICTSLIYI